MSVSALETAVCAKGGNLELVVPSYDAMGNPLTEQAYENTSWQTPALVADALIRAGYTPNDVNIDMDSIAWAVSTYPCVWVIQGQNGQGLGWLSATPTPPNPNSQEEIWEHWECVPATVKGQVLFNVPNSWGEQIGNMGWQQFGQDYIDSGYIVEVIAFIPDSELSPISMPGLSVAQQIWQALCDLFNSNVSLKPIA